MTDNSRSKWLCGECGWRGLDRLLLEQAGSALGRLCPACDSEALIAICDWPDCQAVVTHHHEPTDELLCDKHYAESVP